MKKLQELIKTVQQHQKKTGDLKSVREHLNIGKTLRLSTNDGYTTATLTKSESSAVNKLLQSLIEERDEYISKDRKTLIAIEELIL